MEKRLSVVNSFNNAIINIEAMIAYLKDKNHKTKKKYKDYKTLNTVLESVDTIVIFEATSTSTKLSSTGVGLIILPTSAGTACTLSLGNKVLHNLIMSNYNKYKKHYEKYQQTIKFFDNLFKKFSQNNVIVENENESLCKIFTK